ncbi:hypothetical protein IWQ60_004455 [Tieghemiomyces parasiticus]|uniref:Amino acid transporter transmembrane domain-containing protein n=1 Tax=Tieghemiomyces parasiticus TaxID=78921 RepID=A0A9W8DZ55_9FUNG|nr:hypothetical protein IWQ60_004455 [Tieghemiomyces parasiticus]
MEAKQEHKHVTDGYSFEQDFDAEKAVDHDAGGHGHERNGSSFGAYFNIVCVIAGTGTLQLPESLKEGGWVAIACILLAAAIAVFTGNLLIRCLYYKDGERLSSYPEIGLVSFGKAGKYIISVLNYSICLGGSCVYISIAGNSVYDLATHINVNVSAAVWVIIAAVLVCLPFVLVKSMKEVAILAIFGAVATLVVVIVVMVVGLMDYPANASNTHNVVVWGSLPAAMGNICFSFGGNVVYPHVESAMKNPQSWAKVLIFAVLTILGMYLCIAVVGYHVYGHLATTPIYDNLPKGPTTTVAILMLVAHVILAAPIMLTSFALEVEEAYGITVQRLGKAREFMIRGAFRALTVFILTFPAIFLPVGKLMSLIGSFSNSLMIFVLPIVCYWRLFGIRSMNYASLAFSVICILVGILACVCGTKDAIAGIVKVFTDPESAKGMH